MQGLGGDIVWEATGNHYVAAPCISPADGAIHRLNVLHRGALGLLEWASEREPRGAEPLLALRIRVDGREVRPERLAWERVDRWIPRFRAELGGALRLTATLCFPGAPDRRNAGGVLSVRVENHGREERRVELALEGVWRWSLHTVASTRPLVGSNRVAAGRTPGLVLEMPPIGGPAAALAVHGGPRAAHEAAVGEEPLRAVREDADLVAPNGEAIRIRVARELAVPGRGRATAGFYVAAAPERDGALARAAALRRAGGDALVQEARLDLARLERRVADPALSTTLNRNLNLCHFFGLGRAIDDDRLYPVRSRSPLFAGAGTAHERDTLLWSLPALTLADPETGREVLLRLFEQHAHNAGTLLHYLDGGVLDPEFSLEHLCAYVVALDRFVLETQDASVLSEPPVQDVLREIDTAFELLLDPEVMLAATDVTGSGEAPPFPYVTPANALFWKACEALPRVWVAADAADKPRLADAGEEVAAALWRHAVAEVDGLRVVAWAIDLEGEAAVYDDPAASLMLLPHLGFTDADEPVWRNTVELLHSADYPFWHGDARYPGRASRAHPGAPALAGLCADLLGPRRDEALAVLRRLPLEAGLAHEAFDPASGGPVGDRHHAALGGLLAWSLWHALEAESAS